MWAVLRIGSFLLAVLVSNTVIHAADCAGGDTACWNRRAKEIDAARAWQQSVDRCTGWVKARNPEFDAFVSSAGRVETIGPSRASFEFKKCMAQNGQATN
jgi:hypothetical protein